MAKSLLPRKRGLTGRWLVWGIVLVVGAILVAVFVNGRVGSAGALAPDAVAVTRGTLVATVAGSGSVAAEQSLNLAFQANGIVVDVSVKEGDVVEAGQALARLDDRGLSFQAASARSSLDAASARLTQAQQGNARPEDVAAAQSSAESAQLAYDAAVMSAGTIGSQLAASASALEKARIALQQAQANYDRVASSPNIGMLPQSVSLQNSTIDYNQAKSNYDSLSRTAGTDAASRVASAAAQLAQAKANLAKLTTPATATDLRIQQAGVTQAEQSLKLAELALDNATLKAPFAGVVAQVNVVPGSAGGPGSPALKLINRTPLHVDLRLTENDVAKVQLDQPVKLTIQSLGGYQIDGRVSFVAPAAENVNGVVTYVVRVRFPDSEPRVRVGMTADLSIEVARRDGALLVPNTALLPKGAGRAVQVVSGGSSGAGGVAPTIQEVEVQTGLTDGTFTEILSGLTEGQQVVALPVSGTGSTGGGGLFGGLFRRG